MGDSRVFPHHSLCTRRQLLTTTEDVHDGREVMSLAEWHSSGVFGSFSPRSCSIYGCLSRFPTLGVEAGEAAGIVRASSMK